MRNFRNFQAWIVHFKGRVVTAPKKLRSLGFQLILVDQINDSTIKVLSYLFIFFLINETDNNTDVIKETILAILTHY